MTGAALEVALAPAAQLVGDEFAKLQRDGAGADDREGREQRCLGVAVEVHGTGDNNSVM